MKFYESDPALIIEHEGMFYPFLLDHYRERKSKGTNYTEQFAEFAEDAHRYVGFTTLKQASFHQPAKLVEIDDTTEPRALNQRGA